MPAVTFPPHQLIDNIKKFTVCVIKRTPKTNFWLFFSHKHTQNEHKFSYNKYMNEYPLIWFLSVLHRINCTATVCGRWCCCSCCCFCYCWLWSLGRCVYFFLFLRFSLRFFYIDRNRVSASFDKLTSTIRM